jgi:Cytochrome P450
MNRHNVDAQDTFDPRRFLEEDDKTLKKKVRFGFYPFGKGPKGCAGEYLAMLEMQATMFHLLKTRQVFFATNRSNDGQRQSYSMETMETNWDIAQQPQREEEMQMIVKPLTRQVFFVGPSSTGHVRAISRRQDHTSRLLAIFSNNMA